MKENRKKTPDMQMSHESCSHSGLIVLLYILNILGVDRMSIPVNHFKGLLGSS